MLPRALPTAPLWIVNLIAASYDAKSSTQNCYIIYDVCPGFQLYFCAIFAVYFSFHVPLATKIINELIQALKV